MKYNIHKTHPADNIGVVLEPIQKGGVLAGKDGIRISALADIPVNHKAALADIAAGHAVIKYGEAIGLAGEDIKAGNWVHTHNIRPMEG